MKSRNFKMKMKKHTQNQKSIRMALFCTMRNGIIVKVSFCFFEGRVRNKVSIEKQPKQKKINMKMCLIIRLEN